VIPKNLRVSYRLVNLSSNVVHLPSYTSRSERGDSDWASENTGFENLELGPTYAFEVVNEDGEVLDRRELQTLDLSACPRGVAVISCCGEQMLRPIRDGMWDSVTAVAPNVILMIGDAIYGAHGLSSCDPATLWA